MDTQVTFSILAGCVALAAVLVLLSLHILRREPKDLRERSKNGEILLLTFEQIMALYNAAPEKWEMQVDSPTYYPHGKERDGLLVFMLPKERKRYRKWFDRPVPDDGQGAALHAGGLGRPFAAAAAEQ